MRLTNCFLILAMTMCFAGPGPLARAAEKKQDELPEFKVVDQHVRGHFATQKNYRPGDIISKSDTSPVFEELAKLGWKVADLSEIEAAMPGDGDFIVRQLRTKAGRHFMRKISGDPKAYERLDRLAQLPYGRQTVRDLIRGPGGEKLIQYMDQTKDGTNLRKMLSHTPRGRNFNQSTGKIYTVDALLARLQQSHAAASALTKE